MRYTRDRDTQQKQIEKEMEGLVAESSVNQVHLARMREKLRIENLIETGMIDVPEEIKSLPLPELRIQLVNTALAYKNEQVRNNLFERKLDGARF